MLQDEFKIEEATIKHKKRAGFLSPTLRYEGDMTQFVFACT
jgi:hypothetical protein